MKYTENQFIEACKISTSVRNLLSNLGLVEAGGNYATAKRLIKKLNIDTSHFRKWYNANLGKKFGPKRPIEDYLSNTQKISSDSLKRRLIKDKICEHKCQMCLNKEWLNEPIPLELHHIDGNNENNNINNLQLLCPNCHAKTSNYRGSKLKIKKSCIICGNKTNSSKCRSCASIESNSSKLVRPPKEELENLMIKLNNNMTSIGKEYNVTSTAVRKWLIHYNIYKKRNKH